MTDLDRVISQIKRRSWEKMRASWMSALALVDLDVGTGLEAVPDFESIAQDFINQRRAAEEQLNGELAVFKQKQIQKRSKKPPHNEQAEAAELSKYQATRRSQIYGAIASKRDEVSGVRESLFSEGLRLAEKAFHVLGCAESDAHRGNRSWSLCGGYQASLFASKALLALCGVGFVEINSKTVVVDVFPEPVKNAEDYSEATFSFVSNRFDHRAVWLLFQRILALTVDAPWPSTAVDKLKSVEDKNFSKQRNDMQYRNTYWPFDDLFAYITAGEFGSINHWDTGSEDIDFDRPDISIVIGFYVMKMNLALLSELGIASAKLRPHFDNLFESSVPERHPMYHGLLRC